MYAPFLCPEGVGKSFFRVRRDWMETWSGKVGVVVERYLERLLEPKVIEEASLAQITKMLELLLENGVVGMADGGIGGREEDPVSRGLRELAREMEADR